MFIFIYILHFSMTTKIGLDNALSKAETLFYKYCRKSVIDCFQVVDLPSDKHNVAYTKANKKR